jgi:photosystem I reaction center subunit VIII
MSASFLPFAFVPLVGLVFPRVTMRALFLYIEKESVTLVVFSFSETI